MKPIRLFCPAEDHTWSEAVTTERELQLLKDVASRLSLPINLDEANGKLYLGHAPGWKPQPEAPRQRINEVGLALIKESEGVRLQSYTDAAGVLTIGYGHTGADVSPGMQISMATAEKLLKEDLARFEDGVAKAVTVPLSTNQFSALVSFAFNVGLGAFQGSTLLRKLNAKDYAGAAAQFPAWVKAGGSPLPGLVTRRAREQALFLDNVEAASVSVIPLAQSTSDSCGQTSVAMAINALTGKRLRDVDINAKYGYDLLPALNGECPKHTWTSPDFTKSSWPTIEASLRAGRPVLFAANGPDFSQSGRGHILLIVKIEQSTIWMADPATGTIRSWTKAQCEAAPPHPQGKWLMVATPKK